MRSFRDQLKVGEDVVDPMKWFPQSYGIAPRVRIGASRWFNLLWLLPLGFVILISAVAVAQGLRKVPLVEDFIARHPGTVVSAEAYANPGFPVWVGVQHFFNMFLMIFIIRSGMQILADHPRLYWTRHSTPGKDWFRFQKAVPAEASWTAKQDSVGLPGQIGLPGLRHSIGLARWWHLGVNTLWLLNGLVFYALSFSTGHWRRVVPTSWDVLPNALSMQIQYLSLQWPAEHGWVAYNSLQLLAYFGTLFIAAPAALITGLGMSPALSTRFKRLSRLLSIQTARSLHFLVFIWFLVFIVSHILFVFTTGLRENLNHIYGGRDDNSWIGFAVFALTMIVAIVGWVAATPFTLRHPRIVQRVGFALIGPAQGLFEHVDSTAGTYTERDISPYFWRNGTLPDSEKYAALLARNFDGCRLRISGLVENPLDLSLPQLRALPYHEQITQHFCIPHEWEVAIRHPLPPNGIGGAC
jgi:thiosulfate reductase cytochrome b subunit